MHTSIADERILLFREELNVDDTKEIASRKKVDAFGTVNKVASFLSKPKEEDFKLIYSEHRYEPFWYITGEALYEYERTTTYSWPVSGDEVKEMTVEGKKLLVTDGHVELKGVDHCRQEERIDVYVNGLNSEKNQKLGKYLSYSSQEVDSKKIEMMTKDNVIFIPPVARASAIVREVLSELVKVIQADTIFTEEAKVTHVDLYYRPVFAFRYQWLSKGKEAVVEIDGLTGDVSYGHKTFQEYLGKAVDRDFLFDIGADAAGMFIPGGSLAVKFAKKYIDHKKK